MNASRYFSRILNFFPITLFIERGESYPNYNSFKAQRRLNNKTLRFLKQRERSQKAETELRVRRNELMDEVGESVRYVEISIDNHIHRILLGYEESKGDPSVLAEILGKENEGIFNKCLERNFVATISIPFNSKFSIEKVTTAIRAVIGKKGGSLTYDVTNPVKQSINKGVLEFWCDKKKVQYPTEAFEDRRYARVYVDPVKKLEW